MVAPFVGRITSLGEGILGGEVHQLDEGAPNVNGDVVHKVGLLVRQHNAGRIPPPLIGPCATGSTVGGWECSRVQLGNRLGRAGGLMTLGLGEPKFRSVMLHMQRATFAVRKLMNAESAQGDKNCKATPEACGVISAYKLPKRQCTAYTVGSACLRAG